MSSVELSLKKAGLSNVNNKARETFSSKPANKINIPEIKNLKCSFVYNYFTRDERVRPDSLDSRDRILKLDSSNTDEIFYRTVNDKLARYVKIEFLPPNISSDFYDIDININSLNVNIDQIVNKIIVEGSTPNTIFTGTEIIDTGKENKLYTMLNGSLFFIDVPVERESNLGAISKLYDVLEEKGGLKGQDKKILRESFKNIISDGYRLSSTDVSPEIAKTANDPLGKQSFSIQFNNLLMSEVVESATRIPDTVFQDELRSLREFSREVRSGILGPGNIPPAHTFREADYDLEVDAVSVTALPSTNLDEKEISQLYPGYPEIKFVGYLVEKYEVLPDESTEFIGRRYISGHNSYFSIDSEVRYGGAYFYKIRTVCRVKFIGNIDNEDASLNQLGIVTAFMASEGVISNVYCEEIIPPPAPNVLKAKFDFETLLPKLYWQLPANKQRDIKRFQIFKRMTVEEPFKLLKEYNFDNSDIKSVSSEIIPDEDIIYMRQPKTSFIDLTHKEGEKPIYTIACVDAHGMTSNYGPQIKVERDFLTNKVKQTIISRKGAPKPYPNLYLNVDTFQDAIKTSNYDRMRIIFDPEYYDVVYSTFASGKDKKYNITTEKTLNFLAIDPDKYRYKFHFINIDNQKDQTLDVKVFSKASPAGVGEDVFNVSAAKFSKNNVSFQYGVE
jgi:hypothetical protein|tara:strand:- start:1489 stop:3507 length:2019 start_codon:yes stop_codon:yes gene_type:complete